jgi:hypothetical protein
MAQYYHEYFADNLSWFDSAKTRGAAFKVTDKIPSAHLLPAQEEVFSFRVSGKIKIPRTGQYRFTTVSDDASHVLLDDMHIIENIQPRDHGAIKKDSEWISLKEGQVMSFVAMWGNFGGPHEFTLSWTLSIAGDVVTEYQTSMSAFLL